MTETHNDKHGATAVITHRVKDSKRDEYELWIEKIAPLCRRAPGFLDIQIVRPLIGKTQTYTVILRFSTHSSLQNWMTSVERQVLINEADDYLIHEEHYRIETGLDFLFEKASTQYNIKPPKKWKQFIITLSAIYPLVLFIPSLIIPLLRSIHMPELRALDTFFIAVVIVYLMIFVIMPRYTKKVARWLTN